MRVSDYIIDYLINQQVNAAFGLPGGVVLELMYAMDARKDELVPLLSYHEQVAGFAACGYAQASGRLGVAYATRGPGFTNLITAIAEAYYDSLPVLFITGHSGSILVEGMRVMDDQEIDTVSMVKNITKYALRVDDVCQLQNALIDACHIAQKGRKGPVFLDIATSIMTKNINSVTIQAPVTEAKDVSAVCLDICDSIRKAKRPVMLVGDGVNQAQMQDTFRQFIINAKIPVLSSRVSHDIMCGSAYYFGYVGSHGIRTANFVLSKADLIIVMGNRMHYPVKSESFSPVTSRAKIIRIEIDDAEFNRQVQNAVNYNANLTNVLYGLNNKEYDFGNHEEWLKACDTIREELYKEDVNTCVELIVSIIKRVRPENYIVNDVGNNEFWVSRAFVLTKLQNRVLYSKSFGALGCGLGKAIGTYYATRKPVVCFVGDQGFQMNIQELQFISQHKLPIAIALLNNQASGMIKDREAIAYHGHYVHTTEESGYVNPDFKKIATAYGITYTTLDDLPHGILNIERPLLIEVSVDSELTLSPTLPKGVACQDLYPRIDRQKYEYLNAL